MNQKKSHREGYEMNENSIVPEINDPRYIVKRNGIRVSEEVHTSYESATNELNYWKDLIKRWPDGSKLTIDSF